MVDAEDIRAWIPVVVLVAVVVLPVLVLTSTGGTTPFSDDDDRLTTAERSREPVTADPTPQSTRRTATTTPRTERETAAAATTPRPGEGPNLTFTRPVGSYVVGSEATVAGTASPNVGSVAVYVRTGESWEVVDVTPDGGGNDTVAIGVAGDGTWRATIDRSGAGAVLGTPGRYGLVAVPAGDVRTAAGVRERVTNDTLEDLPSARTTVEVQPRAPPAQSPSLPGSSAILTINRQVALEDNRVAVRGTALGQEEVYVFFIGPNGGLSSTTLPVGRDGVFENDDVPMTTVRGGTLQTGLVVAGAYSVGRDGIVGDGEYRGLNRSALATLNRSEITSIDTLDAFLRLSISNRARGLRGPGLTQRQVLERLEYETVGAPGSDDLLLEDVFLFTSGRTTIESVGYESERNVTSPPRFAPGETMVVQGVTNRKPDNTIFVEVVDGPGAARFEAATASGWGADGLWSVRIRVPPGTRPGTYTIRSDDGDYFDSVRVEVGPDRGNATVGGRRTTEP